MLKKIILASFFLASNLFGATNIPDSQLIYAWGYSDTYNEMFLALKSLLVDDNFLAKFCLGIGIIILAVRVWRNDKINPPYEVGKFLIFYVIIYFFFLFPANTAKNKFMIHDEVTGKDYIVSQIPIGIGSTFSLMSRVEKVILDGMEKHFSTPQSTEFSSAGLGFSLTAIMDLPTLRPAIIEPLLQRNMNLYFKNCLQYDTLSDRIPVSELRKSDDLIHLIFPAVNSKLTLYVEKDATGQISEIPMTCGESAARLQQDFQDTAIKQVADMAYKANVGSRTEYENKFKAVSELYFQNAVGAREQFQQILIMNAFDDSLINTAKILGMDASSIAANSAIASQSITASMQAQGKLAQTFLPAAKVYTTAIILGLSWIMALLSIMFSNFQHLKIFFTLCIAMVLWTPILSIINYLNDLNIRHTFAMTNANVSALTYVNYREVFQKVTENSNYLKYLVMLTPVLAFSLAKGSEMGFATFASSLAQQVAGGARASASFAQQQALSTKSEISTPRAEEVWAVDRGISSLVGANYDSYGNLTSYKTQTGLSGGVSNSELSNSVFSGTNVGGTLQGASLTAGSLNTANSFSKTLSDSYAKSFNDNYSHLSAEGRSSAWAFSKGAMENNDENFRQSFASNFQQALSERNDLNEEQKANIKAYARASVGGGLNIGIAKISGEAGAETSLSGTWTSTRNLSAAEQQAYNEIKERASVQTIANSAGARAEWSKTLRGEDSNTFSKMITETEQHQNALSSVQAMNSNNASNILNGFARDLASQDGRNWNTLTTNEQNKYFADAGANINNAMLSSNVADIANLTKYHNEQGAAMTTNTTMGGTKANSMSYNNIDTSESSVLLNHNRNLDQVGQMGRNMFNSSSLSTTGKQDIKQDSGAFDPDKNNTLKSDGYFDAFKTTEAFEKKKSKADEWNMKEYK